MVKTIFSASQQKKKTKQEALEKELKKIQEEYQENKEQLVKSEEYPTQRSLTMEKTKKTPHRSPADYSQVLRESSEYNGWFSAFLPRPTGMKFETQHEAEQLLLVLRQHPIVNLPWIVIAVVMLFAPTFIFPIFPFFAFLPAQFAFFTFLGWYLFIIIYVIESFLHWYFNIYVITDERIIDIDFYSLIYKSVSEAKIEKIEDVTATTAGFLGAMFNFGTISVQTAAETRQFEFVNVPQPSKVTKFLNELILEEERERIEGRVM